MKKVRFTRDTDPRREGGPGFKKGEVHSLPEDVVKRWALRGAVEEVADKPEPVAEPAAAEPDAAKSMAVEEVAEEAAEQPRRLGRPPKAK